METIKTSNELVVNWHLLEQCQLNCKYCYAHWDGSSLPELYKSERESERLIEQVASLQEITPVRLSLAGGEPLLDKSIAQKIRFAEKTGLKVSVITNGAFLPVRIQDADLRCLAMLGVSIDNFNTQTNINIGRADKSGRVPNYKEIIRYLQRAREINPAIKIKINTVVNLFNWDSNLSAQIEEINPDKWKVLRVLPAIKEVSPQVITDEQFNRFRQTHQHVPCAQFEDNQDMRNSYLMIDPLGRFFFNLNEGYGYSAPVLEVGIKEALRQVRFDVEKFDARYQGEKNVV